MNTEQNKTGAPAAKVADPLWNPYVAGVALGLVFLVSFLVLGHGLGASGAANRVGILALETVAPEHVRDQSFFSTFVGGEGHILNNWLVFAVLGVFLGGAVSSTLAGRWRSQVIRGPRISIRSRLLLAVLGGVLMGVAARLARGCASGQALSGGMVMSVGSWIFMMSMFVGAYALALVVRRQWR